MITEDLFQEVLLKPAVEDCDTLLVVSGYASASMANRHMEAMIQSNKLPRVAIIFGMCRQEGALTQANHESFKHLCSQEYPTKLECRYVVRNSLVHCKTYVWMKDQKPVVAYNGSANYTQQAFLGKQREALSESDPQQGYDQFCRLIKDTEDCRNDLVDNLVTMASGDRMLRSDTNELSETTTTESWTAGVESVEVSLLARNGDVPKTSQLNWGMRQERGFVPEAYLHIEAKMARSGFFPDRNVHFHVITDDDQVMILARTQKIDATSLTTPLDNKEIGRYFRKRLGVDENDPVTIEHLVAYGRSSVVFYKINDDDYYMDFSSPNR